MPPNNAPLDDGKAREKTGTQSSASANASDRGTNPNTQGNTRESFASAALDARLGGGGGANESPPLVERAGVDRPETGHSQKAREISIQAARAEGKSYVSNMSFELAGGRRVEGPVSFNKETGQQFVIDRNSKERFRLMTTETGETSLKLMGRGNQQSEPLPVLQQRHVDGGAAPRTWGQPRAEQPAERPGNRQERPAEQPGGPRNRGGQEGPAEQPGGPRNRGGQEGPAEQSGRPEPQPRAREAEPKPVPRVEPADQFKPFHQGPLEKPVADSDRGGGRRGAGSEQPGGEGDRGGRRWGGPDQAGDADRDRGGRRWHGGNPDQGPDGERGGRRWQGNPDQPGMEGDRSGRRRDGDGPRREGDAPRSEREFGARPPMGANELNELRTRLAQDPAALQKFMERGFERQPGGERGPRVDGERGPRMDGERGPRMDGERGPRMDGRQPPGMERIPGGERGMDRILPGGENRGERGGEHRGERHGQPGDKGGADRIPGIDRIPGADRIAGGDRHGPVLEGKVGHNDHRPDLRPQIEPRSLQIIADSLKNNDSRPALIELLGHLRQGKVPIDQISQINPQNRQLQELIKNLGPEGLQDIRRLMTEKDVGVRGDTKFDANVSPRVKEILDSISLASKLQTEGKTPSSIASERLLDILRQNDKTMPGTRVPDSDLTRSNIQELGKVLKELNLSQPADAGRALVLRDLISRSFDDSRNPNAALPADRRELTLRPQSPEDAIVRTLLDRTNLARLPELDQRRIDVAIRPEVAVPRADQRTEIRIDGRTEVRPDNIGIRPDDTTRGARDLNVKGEIVPGARTDAGQRPEAQPVRSERADVDAGSAQNKTESTNINFANNKTQEASQQQKDKEEEDLRRRKEKELKDKEKDQEEMAADAAALLALQAKKRKELEEKQKQEAAQEKDKKEPEKRVKYVVRPGDTLESIATKMLRDKRLSGLIYEINRDVIPTQLENGKKVPKLQERMVIWLPTPTEAKDYRVRLMSQTGTQPGFASAEDELVARFGSNWSGTGAGADGDAAAEGGSALEDMEGAARAAYETRRKHIESLLGPLSKRPESSKPKHVVRLGDTLKSVAMKHPAMQDVSLWKLLAELNGLSTKTDEKGAPVAKLTRGQALLLPSQADIDAFKQRESGIAPREKLSGPLELPTRSCPKCTRVTFATAVICPACGTRFEGTASAAAPTSTPSVVTSETSDSAVRATKGDSTRIITTDGDVPGDSSNHIFVMAHQFSESARFVTAGTIENLTGGFRLKLEHRLENGDWAPLVMYEVFSAVALRHEYAHAGPRKTIRIDLPPQAAIELATNDIQTNWQNYQSTYAIFRKPD